MDIPPKNKFVLNLVSEAEIICESHTTSVTFIFKLIYKISIKMEENAVE